MTPTEVLKMLKSKIDKAEANKCNYAIETDDIKAINQALLIHDVVGRSEQLFCPECGSDNIREAIHTDYKECNKCYHYWAN